MSVPIDNTKSFLAVEHVWAIT